MKLLTFFSYLALLSAGLLSSPLTLQKVAAQTAPPAEAQPSPPPAAPAPYFVPRGGLRYSTEGAGFDPYFAIEGFFPLQQTPGSSLTFVEGRFILFTTNTPLGGNILVGHRFLNDAGDRTFGGYLAYDNRNTGNAGFSQLGIGLESLSDNLDFRINGYLPIGERRPLISSSFSGLTANQGLLGVNRTRQFEEALPGVDAEVGTRLTTFGEGGVLRGYAGLYYYGGDANTVGVRGRLLALPTDYINVGLTLQNDSRFDTRLTLSVAVTFPGSAATRETTSVSLLNRLGESVERINTITVDKRTVNDSVTLTNRATGQPILVTNLGTGSFDNVQQALSSGLVRSNSTIFVGNVGTNTSNLSLQSGQSLLSTFSTQQIDTAEVGTVTLQGTGVRPTLGGNLTLASNNIVSGFNIGGNLSGDTSNTISNSTIGGSVNLTNSNTLRNSTITGPVTLGTSNTLATSTIGSTVTLTGNNNTLSTVIINSGTGSGVIGTNISGLTIADSTITSSNVNGSVALTNTTGTIAITNTTIANNTLGSGIQLTNNTGSVNLNLTGNRLDNDRTGIAANLSGTAQATGQISNNRIATTTAVAVDGIDLQLSDNAKTQLTIAGNTIGSGTTIGAARNGINVNILNNADSTLTITNNQIANSGGRGIQVNVPASTATPKLRLTLDNNTVTNSGSDGFSIAPADGSQVLITASNNRFTGNQAAGFGTADFDITTLGTANVCLKPVGNTITKFNLDSISFAVTDILVEGALPGTNTITTSMVQGVTTVGTCPPVP